MDPLKGFQQALAKHIALSDLEEVASWRVPFGQVMNMVAAGEIADPGELPEYEPSCSPEVGEPQPYRYKNFTESFWSFLRHLPYPIAELEVLVSPVMDLAAYDVKVIRRKK